MKILKVFGVVVGIHVFALILIFANPGCSSSSKPTPAAAETVAKADPVAAPITVPNTAPNIAFNPDAPATAAPSTGSGLFHPTRPNTPAAQTLVAEPVKDVTPLSTYTVKSGDSLWSIANKNKLSYQELAAANNMKSNAALQPGQKLIIPGKAPRPASAAATTTTTTATADSAPAAKPATDAVAKPAAAAGVHHTVRSGETLGSIAQKYGVKQKDLATANNITDPLKLPLGKDLIIPGWDSAGGKSSTKSSKSSGSGKAKPAETPVVPPSSAADQPPPVITVQPTTSEVPVIRVEETPKKP